MKLATKKRNIFYVHKVHARDKSYMHILNFTCICAHVHAVFQALRQELHLQPSDLRLDALTIELPGIRWQSDCDTGSYMQHSHICTRAILNRGLMF